MGDYDLDNGIDTSNSSKGRGSPDYCNIFFGCIYYKENCDSCKLNTSLPDHLKESIHTMSDSEIVEEVKIHLVLEG